MPPFSGDIDSGGVTFPASFSTPATRLPLTTPLRAPSRNEGLSDDDDDEDDEDDDVDVGERLAASRSTTTSSDELDGLRGGVKNDFVLKDFFGVTRSVDSAGKRGEEKE